MASRPQDNIVRRSKSGPSPNSLGTTCPEKNGSLPRALQNRTVLCFIRSLVTTLLSVWLSSSHSMSKGLRPVASSTKKWNGTYPSFFKCLWQTNRPLVRSLGCRLYPVYATALHALGCVCCIQAQPEFLSSRWLEMELSRLCQRDAHWRLVWPCGLLIVFFSVCLLVWAAVPWYAI